MNEGTKTSTGVQEKKKVVLKSFPLTKMSIGTDLGDTLQQILGLTLLFSFRWVVGNHIPLNPHISGGMRATFPKESITYLLTFLALNCALF